MMKAQFEQKATELTESGKGGGFALAWSLGSGYGVPALAGWAMAFSGALRIFDLALYMDAPPPKGGTPYPDLLSR
jgi:hypothetical protein